MAREFLSLLASFTLLVFGCSVAESPTASGTSTTTAVPRTDGPTGTDYPALCNLLKITDAIYCEGGPHTEEAVADLSRLGIETVVSVDGTQPDVETARKYGLRYLCIPIGYEGIEMKARLRLVRLVRDAKRPFYIHCHRDPAATAAASVSAGEVGRKDGLKLLERAGTRNTSHERCTANRIDSARLHET